MTLTAAAGITALRSTHDELVDLVRDLSSEQLLDPSGATEWSVAQVLSHLGSGAEISLATLHRALEGAGGLPEGFTNGVWDRWNAMTPREQADGFLAAGTALIAAVEALTAEQRDSLRVDLGFLPAPVPVATYVGMRLGEAAAHSWDVRVALDKAAVIDDATARLLVDQLAGQLGFLLGFTAKAGEVSQPAVVDLVGLDHDPSIGDAVALVPSGCTTTATFEGGADAVARLMSGRLAAAHTPAAVTVTGNVSLEDLRRVFPGYRGCLRNTVCALRHDVVMSDDAGRVDEVEIGALAITVAIPEHLRWTDTRRDVEHTLLTLTVRMLPDGHLAVKVYGRPSGGGRSPYVSFPVPDDPALAALVEDAGRRAEDLWSAPRGPA